MTESRPNRPLQLGTGIYWATVFVRCESESRGHGDRELIAFDRVARSSGRS